jgi:hypothetical protein
VQRFSKPYGILYPVTGQVQIGGFEILCSGEFRLRLFLSAAGCETALEFSFLYLPASRLSSNFTFARSFECRKLPTGWFWRAQSIYDGRHTWKLYCNSLTRVFKTNQNFHRRVIDKSFFATRQSFEHGLVN